MIHYLKSMTLVIKTVSIGVVYSSIMSTCVIAMGNDAENGLESYGPLLETDTLWSLANKYRPSIDATVYQTMVAIYDLNPHAFSNGNINHLIVGKQILLPNIANVKMVDDIQARNKFKSDNVSWNKKENKESILVGSYNLKSSKVSSVKLKKNIVINRVPDIDLSRGKSMYYFPSIDSVSLQEVMSLVLANSPRLAQRKEQLKMNEALIDEAKSAWLPQISINANTGRTSSSASKEYGVSINQLLYDFGKTSFNIDAANHNYISSKYQQIAESINVIQQAATYYVEIKRYEGLISTVDKGISDLERIYEMALLRANAGLATKSDSLQIKSRISAMRTSIVQYNSILDEFKMKMSVLTGVSVNQYKDFYISDAGLSAPDDRDLSKIPVILMAKANVATAQKNVKKVERSGMPIISLSAGRKMKHDNNDSAWEDQVNINLNYPLYQGGALSAQVKQASGNLYIAKRDLQQLKLDIMQSIQIAENKWTSSKRQKDESLEQYSNATEAKLIYEDEYLLGKRGLSDLLSVEQDLIQSTQSNLNADADAWLAIVDYYSATGQLLKKITDSKYN